MKTINQISERLAQDPRTWLVTGAAGFIGSNLAEALLRLGQRVFGLDNFATGKPANIDLLKSLDGGSFEFIEADICDLNACHDACRGADFVLHQAALGSVPRSIDNPIRTNQANIDGFLNMLVAARDTGIRRFIYAASSSTYGDIQDNPKIEDRIGRPLSPYAITKYVNEMYADIFSETYGLDCIGLRYFNVFGPRQDPEGAYAAVIPKWVQSMLNGETVCINGDGETSRDFCYVANVVQANLLAATSENPEAVNQVYNVAVGDSTTLNQLYAIIRDQLVVKCEAVAAKGPEYRPFRPGDVRHSRADIDKARRLLGYEPSHTLTQGMLEALEYYRHLAQAGTPSG